MNKAIAATQKDFESSCSKTPEYLSWHRMFKRDFTKYLTSLGVTEVCIGKSNHFDMSGFFRFHPTGQCWYFSISDLRWSKDTMLVRTATSFTDYTGGRNQYAALTKGEAAFKRDFERIVLA